MEQATSVVNFDSQLMNIVRTFANRLSRYFYLQYYCLQDHPVLTTEKRLLDMIVIQIKELINSDQNIKEQEILFRVKSYVKDITKLKINMNVDDDDIRQILLQQLYNYDFDNLLAKSC